MQILCGVPSPPDFLHFVLIMPLFGSYLTEGLVPFSSLWTIEPTCILSYYHLAKYAFEFMSIKSHLNNRTIFRKKLKLTFLAYY